MNILASSPPPPPTTHIHIHIWWSVVFSQLISGQINQRPYLQSICWEGAVGSRRLSNMLDNNRKWRDSTQTLQASHFTSLCSVDTDVRQREVLFFFFEHDTKNFCGSAKGNLFISVEFVHQSRTFCVREAESVVSGLTSWKCRTLPDALPIFKNSIQRLLCNA